MGILASLGVNETVFVQFGIFLVVFVVLKALLFNPYFKAFRQRKENTVGQSEAAVRYLNEATALEKKYSDEVREINQKSKAIFDQSRADVTREHDQIIQAARTKARQSIEASRATVEKEIRDARQKMQPEVPVLGQMITSKLVGKDLSQ